MFNIAKIVKIFKDYSCIASAYLFGSHAAGKICPMSDVDIGILLKDNLSGGRELMKKMDYLAYRIEDAIREGEVDLIILNTQGLIFQHNVLRTGRLIYEADHAFRIGFEMKVISKFCDFEPTLRFMDKYHFEGYKRRLARL